MFNSLKRGLPRIVAMLIIGFLFFIPAQTEPTALGPTLAPLFYVFGLTFFGLAVGDAALRILQPKVDAQAAAQEAMKDHNTAAALVYLGRCILASVLMLLIVSASRV